MFISPLVSLSPLGGVGQFWTSHYVYLKSNPIWYRREINRSLGYFKLDYSEDSGVTWENLITLDLTENLPVIDLAHIYHHRIVDYEYRVDNFLTGLGYSGVEGVDWENLYTTSGYWTPENLAEKCVGWFKESEEVGGVQPNKMDGGTTVLTVVSGLGLNKVYQLPAGWVAYDTDFAWWKTDTSLSVTDGNRLIAYDFARTIVKYDNTSPYTIREIIILSEALTTDEMNKLRDYADLSIWWDGTLSSHGTWKQNRGIGQSAWTVEELPFAVPSGLTLTLISGGVQVDWTDNSGGLAQTRIYAKIDSGSYTLVTTVAAGTSTFDDIRTPEDLITYKICSYTTGGSESAYTSEATKVMLGVNIVPSASSDFTTDGTAYWTPYGTSIVWNNVTHDMTCNQAGTGDVPFYRNSTMTIGKNYLVRVDAKSDNLTTKLSVSNASGGVMTDITNFNLTTTYQTFKFRGVQAINTYFALKTAPASQTAKSCTIDNIKIQEIL